MERINLLAKISLVYLSLYFFVFLFGFYSYLLFWGQPDHNKVSSGLYIGFLVSIVPFGLIAWKLNSRKNDYENIYKLGLYLILINIIFEKVIPLTFSYFWEQTDQIDNSYIFLSEIFTYFIFKEYYLLGSISVSILTFIIGCKISSRNK
ncbi:hypothetical protein HQN90_34065 [Paenibacillus alba]|uniref:hypothetical protein n=1 Tax=Paenibacillus alba TaxID=1197127 RepID=UPI001564BEDD|nr:hypothetical protein [Paenibacillus alba]NQX71160.1 hypothetical protein [Paenibacillus alba]